MSGQSLSEILTCLLLLSTPPFPPPYPQPLCPSSLSLIFLKELISPSLSQPPPPLLLPLPPPHLPGFVALEVDALPTTWSPRRNVKETRGKEWGVRGGKLTLTHEQRSNERDSGRNQSPCISLPQEKEERARAREREREGGGGGGEDFVGANVKRLNGNSTHAEELLVLQGCPVLVCQAPSASFQHAAAPSCLVVAAFLFTQDQSVGPVNVPQAHGPHAECQAP